MEHCKSCFYLPSCQFLFKDKNKNIKIRSKKFKINNKDTRMTSMMSF